MVDIGAKAPNFSLLNTKREAVSLESMKGKNVVVAFFPAAFTGVCEKELCTFRDSMAKFNDLNANVVGICVDAPFSNAAFAERNNLNFDVLSDYQREAVKAYGVAHDDFANMPGYTAAKRSVFVVNGDGNVAFSWVADNPGQEPDYAAVTSAVEALKS